MLPLSLRTFVISKYYIFANFPSILPSKQHAGGEYELHKATPVLVSDAAVASQSDSHGPSSASEDLSSLTPSESSDTTRIYDLTNRQTSLLQHDIIRCSRLPALEPMTGMQTPPSSPIDATLEHRQSTKHYLSERSASFQQLAEFKRAIEKNNQPLSVTVKPSNGVQQYFGKPAIQAVATAAKTSSMEIAEETSVTSAGPVVEATTAAPVVESVPPTVNGVAIDEPITSAVEQNNDAEPQPANGVSDVSEIEVDEAEDFEVRQVTDAMEVDDRRVCKLSTQF